MSLWVRFFRHNAAIKAKHRNAKALSRRCASFPDLPRRRQCMEIVP